MASASEPLRDSLLGVRNASKPPNVDVEQPTGDRSRAAQPLDEVQCSTQIPQLSVQSSDCSMAASSTINPAYPTWDDWRFRQTLAYWVAMMFLEGSILFTIGGSFAFFAEYVTDAELPKAFSPATVLAPYLVGSYARPPRQRCLLHSPTPAPPSLLVPNGRPELVPSCLTPHMPCESARRINFTLGAWFGIEELLRLPRSRPNQRLRRPRIFCFTRPHHWRRIREVRPSQTQDPTQIRAIRRRDSRRLTDFHHAPPNPVAHVSHTSPARRP